MLRLKLEFSMKFRKFNYEVTRMTAIKTKCDTVETFWSIIQPNLSSLNLLSNATDQITWFNSHASINTDCRFILLEIHI